MEKSRNSRTFLHYLSLCFGTAGRRALAGLLASVKARTGPFSLSECLQPAGMAIVLPEDRGEALLQVRNVVSIAGAMSETRMTVVCESDVAPYFANLQGISSVLSYDVEDRFLFSGALSSIAKALAHEGNDMCLMLEREPHQSLLCLAAESGAKIRIGYDGAGEYPYLNIHVRESKDRTYVGDKNVLMAETLGIEPLKSIRWTVPKESDTEVRHLLRDHGVLGRPTSIVGIDISYLWEYADAEWVEALVDHIGRQLGITLYLYVDGAAASGFSEWLRRVGQPVVANLSALRTVALISRTRVIISGKAPIFHLSQLVGTRAVGIFQATEIEAYYHESSICKAVSFSEKPDRRTIEHTGREVAALLPTSSRISGAGKK
ncbi:MAG: hypothetical protein GF344_10105 [Chitinivibrionales bacterium]|nr:hypothetical protein [Chitinivibrionales bacterium]MBD3357187.1 hypothetical protein [Chitinivibrionales bacterium]